MTATLVPLHTTPTVLGDVRVLPRTLRARATGRLGAIDYSFDPPDDLADYRAAYNDGVRGFLRYLSPSSGKDFTPAEVETIHSLGPDAWVLTLWEQGAGDALGGFSVGQRHADGWRAGLAALQRQVGYAQRNKPGGAFAFDQDFGSAQYAPLDNYCGGVRRELADSAWIIGYGKHALLEHFRGGGLIDKRYLTYAWLYGFIPGTKDAEIYQYLNGQRAWSATVDYCQVNAAPASFGAWFRPGSPYDTPVTDPLDALEAMMAAWPDAPKTYAQFRADRVADLTAHRRLVRTMLLNQSAFDQNGTERGFWNRKTLGGIAANGGVKGLIRTAVADVRAALAAAPRAHVAEHSRPTPGGDQ